MRYILVVLTLILCFISICYYVPFVFAQGGGFLSSSPTENMLPPEAVHEGTQVLHKITSVQENLHLLAGYYYGNTRLWKKIYNDNRSVIKNPNRLPVGQTLRIQVEETWRPKFSYQEWLRLATRNGEWKPGVPWQRAVKVPVPKSPPPGAGKAPLPEAQATPTPQETPKTTTPETPEKQPEKKPVTEETQKEKTPKEEPPAEETPEGEQAPAF